MAAKEQTYYAYRTPHGYITVGTTDGAISAVALGNVTMPGVSRPTELSNICATQLLEYFAGKRTAFNIPLNPEGSDFQRKVWEALVKIPYGETRTTTDIAEEIGNPSAFRMVGAAVKKNPLVVIVPAHRIVGANGRIAGVDLVAQRKAAFLELERRVLARRAQ